MAARSKGAFLAPAVVVLVVANAWLTRPAPEAPLGEVGDFKLVDQAGRPVTRSELIGHPWLVDFVFTRCGGPCPKLSDGMSRIQEHVAGTDARLVSITVDPDHDSSALLAAYAKAHGATERWLFLTGDVVAISSLVYDSFHLPMLKNAAAAPGELVTHSSRFALVDRAGKIRRYYDPLGDAAVISDEQVAAIGRDVRALGNGSSLPLVNAALNATSALLLILGWVFIRADRTGPHAACMLGALVVSAVFLGCYLYYHATCASTPFTGEGAAKALYLTILISHIVLAVPQVPLSVGTAILGLRGRWDPHRRWARVTFPIWMYVSVTGVAVYALLYEIYRP